MISLSHLNNCRSIIDLPTQWGPYSELPVVTDSRKYSAPSLFVAIPGAKVNPLDLLEKMLTNECPLVFFQDCKENQEKVLSLKKRFPKTIFVSVSDSITFLQELAHEHVKWWKSLNLQNTVFAISGSNGKTTHKEMLAYILNKLRPGKIVSTEKNNNNHLGVPLTLLQITRETEMVVLELGSNHPGEIKTLCDISLPSAGLTTNIGATHLEFFQTLENVFHEEAYLFEAVKENTRGNGFFLINQDDDFLKTLLPFKGCLRYGVSAEATARIEILPKGAAISHAEKNIKVENHQITGMHNKINLVTCGFVALHFYPNSLREICTYAEQFAPTKNRSEWLEVQGHFVFLDAYNANPSSMRLALEGFMERVLELGLSSDEACVVMGDMNELGEKSDYYHQEVGKFVNSLGLKNIFFIGKYAPHYRLGCGGGACFESTKDFKERYRAEFLKKFPVHFIKGSRSLQLESLFDIT